MTDRELLMLAAKAAGLWDAANNCIDIPWSPLTDDGDALRLAIKLRMIIEPMRTMGGDFVGVSVYPSGRGDCGVTEAFGDPEAATCRAIVRAAAEIGKERTG